jgi:hypothetical protein
MGVETPLSPFDQAVRGQEQIRSAPRYWPARIREQISGVFVDVVGAKNNTPVENGMVGSESVNTRRAPRKTPTRGRENYSRNAPRVSSGAEDDGGELIDLVGCRMHGSGLDGCEPEVLKYPEIPGTKPYLLTGPAWIAYNALACRRH